MKQLVGKRILITGGTGSFGNALLDKLLDLDAELIVFSRDEKKQHDMMVNRLNKNVKYIIGDIRNRMKLSRVFKDVDYIFHAAALKHVPTGENFPEEVIETNVLGIKNVLEAAEECGVKKVVNLSTDKAVYPINAYGMSKALGEKVVAAFEGDTICLSLRYGNVLGSRGSVLPLFLEQISKNKPLTITNPYMTRFLLLLDQAVDLALKCLFDGKSGDLFVIKSPSCEIRTLTEALELHFKRKFEKKTIGIRPGEKMHETLLTSDEVFRSIDLTENNINFVRVPKQKTETEDYFFKGERETRPEPYTSANTIRYNAKQTLELIKQSNLL
ncbi:MAG: polysaccharide biosynthesis protein [Candidatus Aenigmarchaeota archaeon]|nr:polysaccharide biosynthesis protein [Candidatus Aenigmarchaeota archaeon]